MLCCALILALLEQYVKHYFRIFSNFFSDSISAPFFVSALIMYTYRPDATIPRPKGMNQDNGSPRAPRHALTYPRVPAQQTTQTASRVQNVGLWECRTDREAGRQAEQTMPVYAGEPRPYLPVPFGIGNDTGKRIMERIRELEWMFDCGSSLVEWLCGGVVV